ncbi:MAG: PAS domain S-box protein [Sulfuritalea sp.]|nr:PAS domain S-box protein [Sulfuritalea sp.]
MFESTNEGIMVTDTDARILLVNPAFTAITGWSAAEAVGQTPAILKSGRYPPEFYANMWGSISDKGHWEGEIWNRRKNGEIYVRWININAIRDQPRQRLRRSHPLFLRYHCAKTREEKSGARPISMHSPGWPIAACSTTASMRAWRPLPPLTTRPSGSCSSTSTTSSGSMTPTATVPAGNLRSRAADAGAACAKAM